MDVPSIRTKRLLLRGLRDDDAADYAEMCADPDVMRYLGSGPLAPDDAWRQLAMFAGHWALRGFGMWAVEDPSGQFLGRVGLHFPRGWPERELGWALARRHWGQGYALEAAVAARDHAFEAHGWARLVSFIHPENARSVKLAGRLGGLPTEAITLRGHQVRVFVYSPGSAPHG